MVEIKQLIFFDFEMMCSKGPMPFSEMEGIRLGAVKYDLKTKKVSYFDRFIKPRNIQPLSDFCKSLTGIDDNDLEAAKPFSIVFEEFLTWVGGIKKSRFFSWSKNDLTRLKHDAQYNNIAVTTISKFEKRYCDFQDVFTRRVSKTNFSVENALHLYGMEFEGDKHNPMYDALNTLRIYLAYSQEKVKTDLIMVKEFLSIQEPLNRKNVNRKVRRHLKNDIHLFVNELNCTYNLKDARKQVKKARKLVTKYENIIINRSGLFDKDLIHDINIIIAFYNDLLVTYEEHFFHSSKIVIIDDHIILPLKQLAV